MKPTLLILAAGLGSRYGSMKQMEGFGPSGETIMDYSLYDARKAGFGKFVFVISPDMEEDFKIHYLSRLPHEMDVDYVIQSINSIPEGFRISEKRKKPWGTGHAVLLSAPKIFTPFAVINADDFYGRSAFSLIADFLTDKKETSFLEFCIAGYRINNTLSDYGTVSRGVCEIDEHGFLTDITERTRVCRTNGEVVFLDENDIEHKIPDSALVSMNLLGFTPGIFDFLEKYFNEFLLQNSGDPKAEFYIPFAVNLMIQEGIARTRVLETSEKWFGITYQDDKPHVTEMIRRLTGDNIYPSKLWP